MRTSTQMLLKKLNHRDIQQALHHTKLIQQNRLLVNNRYSYKEKLWQPDHKIRDVETQLSEHLKKLIPQSSIFLSE